MEFGRGLGEKKHYMRVAILEDYQKASPALACFAKLAGHEVTVFSEPMRDGSALVSKLNQFEALILIRERTRITNTLLERLPRLKLIVQTAKIGPHVDVKACQARGVTATPHLGFVERGSYEKYFGDAFDAVNAYAAGSPIRVVD